jgi:DNA modification methylase
MTAPYYADDLVTLYHGDARDVAEWQEAAVLVTDPPYGVGYRTRRADVAAIVGDHSTAARDDILALWGDRPALVFGQWTQPKPERTRQLIVWDKRGGAGFSGDLKMPWATQTEEVYVLGEGWVGRRRSAIISVPTLPANNRPDHPTPKPVRLMAELISACPSGLIADPFAGSGPTLVAARESGRQAVGVEIDERHCELIAKRLSQQAFDLEGL